MCIRDRDAAFGFRQLVDMSLKALSPGINDTTTAVTCIEHLSALLTHCAPHPARAAQHVRDGTLRVIAQRHGFAYLVSLAFEQILENGRNNAEILQRLMLAIEKIAGATSDSDRIGALRMQLDDIAEVIDMAPRTSQVRHRLQARLAAVRKVLDSRSHADHA